MKKASVLVALAALLLAGCSASSSSDTVGSVNDTFQSSQAQTQDFSSSSPDETYLRDVRAANNPYLMDETDASLLEVGHQTCDLLDQGYTVNDLITVLLSDNPSDAQIKYEAIIIGTAIRDMCPAYLDQVNG